LFKVKRKGEVLNISVDARVMLRDLECRGYIWNAEVTSGMQRLHLECRGYIWNAEVTFEFHFYKYLAALVIFQYSKITI
jgi:hypothetical protein